MYKRILVPVDGSDTAVRGLAEAIELAKEQGATLRVIHVANETMAIATYEGVIYTADLVDSLREAGKKLLTRLADQVASAGVKVESALLEAHGGSAGTCIVEDANTWKADLIVLGTHGRRGLARVVMGSDAEQVVRQAIVPVLLVKGLPGK